jgi:hypothetical protein
MDHSFILTDRIVSQNDFATIADPRLPGRGNQHLLGFVRASAIKALGSGGLVHPVSFVLQTHWI